MFSQLITYVPAHGGIQEHGGAVLRRLGSHDSIVLEPLERPAEFSEVVGGKPMQEVVFEDVTGAESLPPVQLQNQGGLIPPQLPHGERNCTGTYV